MRNPICDSRAPRPAAAAVPALLVLLVIVSPASVARAGPVTGIAVLGDSLVDEYQFAQFLPPGADRRLVPNFIEVLADDEQRDVNFGAFSDVARPDIREKGFAFNWAKDGSTSATMLSSGQHTGAAAQAAGGEVNLAWMNVGANNFRALFTPDVITSPNPQPIIEATVVSTLTDVNVAIQTLLASSPALNIVVANLPDLRATPGLKAAIAQTPPLAAFAAGVDQAIQAYNAQLKVLADSSNRIAIADAYALSQPAAAGLPIVVDGLVMDTNVPGLGPEHFFVDAIHPNTAGSLLLGNRFIDAGNAEFDTDLLPLSEREIRLKVIPLPAPLLPAAVGVALVALRGVLTRRKAA